MVDRSGRRLPIVLLLAAMVLSSGVPAVADEPRARDIDRVCPAPNATADDADGDGTDGGDAPVFPDLGTTHPDSIVCAADYGIVSGFSDGTFRPARPISRGQMASFVAQWVRTAAVASALPVPAEAGFSDIEGNIHAEAIAALAAAGIVSGRGDGTFAPEQPLTRGQFTRAVANAISYADVFTVDGPLPPADTSVEFPDVAGTTFETSILSLAGVGIALGTADGSFQPQRSVTRGQLTTFLMRAADYLDRHQRWRPTALAPVLLVADLEGVPSPDAPGDEVPADAPLRGSATLRVDAFNGTMRYILELAELPGPYADPGATLHLGDPAADGPVALVLADRATLDAATDDGATGTVREADSALRFADLLLAPGDAYVQVATAEGTVRGVLRSPAD